MSLIKHSDLTDSLLRETTREGSLILTSDESISYGAIGMGIRNLAPGQIVLKLGFAGYGPTRARAYGARHIWEKHQSDLRIKNPNQLPNVIMDILQPGVDILINKNHARAPDRPVILNTSKGCVILTYIKHGKESVYSIVSAYGRRNTPGTVVGELQRADINFLMK